MKWRKGRGGGVSEYLHSIECLYKPPLRPGIHHSFRADMA